MRFHLFPFRTEKLSSLTPMVLRFSRGRVGSRLFKRRPNESSIFSFLFAQVSAAPYLNGDLAVRYVLSKSPFFIAAQHNSYANRKMERSKFGASLEEEATCSLQGRHIVIDASELDCDV